MIMPESSPIASKCILVTGGAGAIGCHVVRKLSSAKEVIVVDNLSSGSLNYLPGGNVTPHVFDIRDADKLSAIFREKQIDAVIHLAAQFANQNSVDFPATDLDVNIKGTLALLEQCKEHGSKFIYASSSCVYGQKPGRLSENLSIDDLHTPYAISKYSGELYSKFYATHFSVPTIALRLFNNFGPFEDPGQYRNVIPNFIARALRNEPLVITGTGEETRDFNYVANTAWAFQLATAACFESNHNFELFNVGTGQETTIIDLAKKIKALTNSRSEIEILGVRRNWDNAVSRCADIDSISTRLGYSAQTGLDEGLSKTIDWFRGNEAIWQSDRRN